MEIEIVLPVCHADIARAKQSLELIKQFGGVSPFLVFTWGAGWDKEEVLSVMPCRHTVLETENEMGWPEACNHLFQQTAYILNNSGNKKPWFFMEADCLPLRAGWYEELCQEYENAGKPYMGVVTPTMWVNLQTHERWMDGEHMVGCGIYPADFVTRETGFELVDRHAWDTEIGDKVVPFTHNTKLMAHRWQTVNYRKNDEGLLIMDDVPKEDVDSRVKPIPPEAVTLHGVKDDSLYKLLKAA